HPAPIQSPVCLAQALPATERATVAPCNRHDAPVSSRIWGTGGRGNKKAGQQEAAMGLLDVINGMQQGPRGPSTPSAPSSDSSGGGMSPMTMAILGLLAWKAFKHLTGGQPGAPEPQAPTPTGRGAATGPGGSPGSALGANPGGSVGAAPGGGGLG